MRAETLDEHPELEPVLNKLAGKISGDEMREMNYLVDVEGENATDVARNYLEENNIID